MASRMNPDSEQRHSEDESEPGRFSLESKSVHCPHCGGADFKAGEAQLNTALATLFKLDWTNKSAAILICASCGQIQWFETPPLKIN